jgi:hypothetical protein
MEDLLGKENMNINRSVNKSIAGKGVTTLNNREQPSQSKSIKPATPIIAPSRMSTIKKQKQ